MESCTAAYCRAAGRVRRAITSSRWRRSPSWTKRTCAKTEWAQETERRLSGEIEHLRNQIIDTIAS